MDPQLAVDPPEVKVDRLRAQIKFGCDLLVGCPLGNRERNPHLLGAELVGVGDRVALYRSSSAQLGIGPLGPGSCPEFIEDFKGLAEPFAAVHPPASAVQP